MGQTAGTRSEPKGVYLWSWFGCRFFPWDNIEEIRSLEKRGPVIDIVERPGVGARDPADSWLCRSGLFRDYMRRINAGYLAVDPAVAYNALRL